MELVLRFLDCKQGAVHRKHWGECSSATLWQPVGVRGDKKENKLIQMSYKYDITNTNGSYKWLIQMYKKA